MWLHRAGILHSKTMEESSHVTSSPTTVAGSSSMEKKRSEVQVIVAMKGHPGTGKSTLARAVASALRWPLLDKDDIRDCTQSLLQSQPQPLLNDLSYSVLFRLARTQLSLGLSLVLDSPLSRRAHLDLLLSLARGARVAVVECRPRDEAEWRRRLEERGRRRTAEGEEEEGSGHKPATWEELQRLIDGYDGCWDYDMGEVTRMVVDTTGGERVDDLAGKVVEFVRSLM